MISRPAPTLFTARSNQLPIETARAVAVLLLVSYHVIGADPLEGLQIDYPSRLRLFADFFVDLRMPLFAMIAGMVFAMKPLSPSGLPGFLLGKLRRLILPGVIAMLAFEIAAHLGHTQLDVKTHYLQPFVTGYAHFWFLQSILLIFLVYAPLDSLTGGAIAPYALIAACVLSLSRVSVPHDPFSIDGAMMLLPYFILGVIVWRHRHWVLARRFRLLAAACLLVVIGSAWNLQILRDTGVFSDERRDLQSLLSATGGCMAAMLALPHLRLLDRIGALSFTIYLYHVFGTSLMRRALDAAGLDSMALQFVLGLLAGIALPAVIHALAERRDLTRVLVLGLKPVWSREDRVDPASARATRPDDDRSDPVGWRSP